MTEKPALTRTSLTLSEVRRMSHTNSADLPDLIKFEVRQGRGRHTDTLWFVRRWTGIGWIDLEATPKNLEAATLVVDERGLL